MNLADLTCPVFAHVVCWFGSGNVAHKDMNYNSADPAVIAQQIAHIKEKGITGVNPLWSGNDGGKDRAFSTRAVVQWMRQCEKSAVPFFLTIDHPETFSLDSVRDLATYFSSPQYFQWNGKPVLFAFDPLTDAQLAILPDCVLCYRNAGGLTKPFAGGAFEWMNPPATQSNTDYFHKMTAGVTGKLICNHVCPGFVGAPWNRPDQVIPWRGGQEWEDSKKRLPANPMMVLIATWNDHDEGTGIEFTYLR